MLIDCNDMNEMNINLDPATSSSDRNTFVL